MSTQSDCQHLEKIIISDWYICVNLLERYIHKYVTINFSQHLQFLEEFSDQGEPLFWNSLWKHIFYPKYPNRIFVNSIWLHTPRKKIGVLFLSVYWQVSHYQLFRTLKTFQNNSLSWVNRSSEPHHENVIFIQNN